MINRFLIRVKVIQALYSYVLNRPDRTVKQAVHELQNSFDKSYELYFYFLQLIVELTNMQDRRAQQVLAHRGGDESRHPVYRQPLGETA